MPLSVPHFDMKGFAKFRLPSFFTFVIFSIKSAELVHSNIDLIIYRFRQV